MKIRNNETGFTIVELMIATAVFAVILLVITTAVIQFTKQYYHGLIANETQNTTRTIMDEVTRSIQFNTGDVTPISGGSPARQTGQCVGSGKLYSFVLNRQVEASPTGTHQGKHALVTSNVSSCNSSTVPLTLNVNDALPPSSDATYGNSKELLGQHMRLSKFSIVANGENYTVTVKVMYGDDDMFCSPSLQECAPGSTAHQGIDNNADDLACRQSSGSQFCAVSELQTTVSKRVNI